MGGTKGMEKLQVAACSAAGVGVQGQPKVGVAFAHALLELLDCEGEQV